VSPLLDEHLSGWRQPWWIRIDATAEILRPVPMADPVVWAALAPLEAKGPQCQNASSAPRWDE
jgi:hypothetical protein